MQQATKLAILAGVIVTLPACLAAQNSAAASWPGTWPPPPGMNCPRSNGMTWSNVASDLTDLHESPACVPQPACFGQRSPQQIYLGPVWFGSNTQPLTIAQQDSAIITARNGALAQAPGGKQLYRLTFQTSLGSPNNAVIATAFYGYCRTRRSGNIDPRDPQ